MSESITLSLPRTKCENVRVLFSRIRLLFGVSVDAAPDAAGELGPSAGKGAVTLVGTSTSEEKTRFSLTVIEGGHDVLEKAKDYLLAACSEASSRCERRCQYSPDIFQQLIPMRDEVERESSAIVRFEQDNLVVITGQERNVLAAIRFLDAKAQEIVVVRSKAQQQQSGSSYSSSSCLQGPVEGVEARKSAICAVGLSIGGTQSREIFRQCRNLESEDSSYDSDYENTEPATPQDPTSGLHHDDVSRTVSDTLAAEFAEYITRGSSDSGQKLRDLATILADPSYTSRVEFALKLGYTEAQVQVALQKLGAQPSQNELLAELIKLGATVKSVGEDSQKDDLEDIISESATCESIVRTQEVFDDSANLRHIVIDGSNVAMRCREKRQRIELELKTEKDDYTENRSNIN